MNLLTESDRILLNQLQRDVPLCSRPFQRAAAALGWSEQAVIERLQVLEQDGVISRFGGVFTPNLVGASTLVAMRVPPEELESVAAVVSSIPGVNHNYQRQHSFNLWFVLTAPNRADIDSTLEQLQQQFALPLLDLPMEQAYHIDLGFAL